MNIFLPVLQFLILFIQAQNEEIISNADKTSLYAANNSSSSYTVILYEFDDGTCNLRTNNCKWYKDSRCHREDPDLKDDFKNAIIDQLELFKEYLYVCKDCLSPCEDDKGNEYNSIVMQCKNGKETKLMFKE